MIRDLFHRPRKASFALFALTLASVGYNSVLLGQSTASRTVAGNTINLSINPDSSVLVYAVEDNLADGLTPDLISGGGEFDPVNRKVKWGPFFDNNTRDLSYQITGPEGTYILGGIANFDNGLGQENVDITGPVDFFLAIRTLTVVNGTGTGSYYTGFSFVIESDPPPVGQRFAQWTGDIAILDDAVSIAPTVTMPENDATITATYEDLPSGTATRAIVDNGTNAPLVTTIIVPDPDITEYAVFEAIPPGLTPDSISNGGSWNDGSRVLSWGPFPDGIIRDLTYRLSGPGGVYTLAGSVLFNTGIENSTTGEDSVTLNFPPDAANDTASVTAGESVVINVLQNDGDTDGNIVPASVIVVGGASHGDTTVNPNGSITYAADLTYSGPDVFTYSVSDDDGSTDTAVVTITVEAPPGVLFDVWIANFFTEGELNDPLLEATLWGEVADPDGDGVPNLLELFFAKDPRASEAGPLFEFDLVESGFSFRFERTKDLNGISFTLETSDDFQTFVSASFQEQVLQDLGHTEWVELSVPDDILSSGKFFQIRVSRTD